MSCGVRKLPIGGLTPDVNNALIVGVIIAKQTFRMFISKKDSEERGVWNFTLRDSPVDTINVTVWGSAQFTSYTHEIFNTGDVVEIITPRISFKQGGSSDSVFNPDVTSPFQLSLQENISELNPYLEENTADIKKLIHIPTKSPGDFLRLSDVISYSRRFKGEYVNLLVAVRNIGEIRTVKSRKDSKDLLCRHLTVMDQSHLEFHITLWNEDLIKRSDFWRSRYTVIFLADVKVDWDNFKRAMTASITSRTIVTENPSTNEAEALKLYAKTAPIQPEAILDHFASNIIDPNSVTAVMTTAQVLDKAYDSNSNTSQFTALIYATITHLDLDGPGNVVAYKCSNCFQFLDETGNCLNMECLTISRAEFRCPETAFNLQINLTDHRGTLYNCRLVSPTADEVLGCSATRYLNMTAEEKTALKWNLLLSRCEVRILVLNISPERPRPLISVLTCKPVATDVVASKLPFY